MSNITVVTAFFDIGRKDFNTLPRNNDKYFNDFKFWARLNNDLIVYTEEIFKNRVLEIRDSFGLAERTKIIIIDNIFDIEPLIFKAMKEISENKIFQNFRLLPYALSGKANYSYLMLLKAWFINDAVSKKLTTDVVSWIDFGFNHGGALYTNPLDFDYEWKFQFEDKIHLFALREPLARPIFEIVRQLDDYIMGAIMIIPSKFASIFWNDMKNSMVSLNDVGLIDDDQLLLIMAYRKNPSIYKIVKSDWFLPLKEYGGEHLTIQEKRTQNSVRITMSKIYSNYIRKRKKNKIISQYLKITKKVLNEKNR